MPGIRLGVLRPLLIILLVVAGVFLASKLGGELRPADRPAASTAPVAAAEIHLRFGRDQLDVVATTASPSHEDALTELLADQFANTQVEADFREGLLLPAEWESITTRLLYVVAATDSATAVADEESISIRAATQDLQEYQSRLMFLREALDADHQLESEIISASSNDSIESLCARNFAAITAQTDGTRQALRFRQSSTALGDSAQALLDQLAEFAFDCRDARIVIVGYTDSTGTEPWNLQVSEARAQAVAAQLISRGVAADRLLVEGRGSTSPLADNDTVQGRTQNRRIEFELR